MNRSRFVLLPLAVVLPLGLVATSACSPPAAAPTHAESTAGLKVCWNPDDQSEVSPGTTALRNAFGKRLEAAGYKLVPRRCDLQVRWGFETGSYQGSSSYYTKINLVVRDAKDQILEKIVLERARGDAPIDQPDLVAVPMVNAMNSSAAIATYASTRHHAKGDAGAADAGPELASPDAASTAL